MKMVRGISFVVVALVGFAATTLEGQQPPKVELGTQASLSFLTAGGSTLTTIGVPGGGTFGSPMVYASFFVSPNVAIEPQLSFARASGEGFSSSTAGLAGQVKYLFRGASESSPYIAGQGALLRVASGDDSETEYGAGAALGYRAVVHDNMAVNIEGRYRRWFDEFEDLNEITISIGFGVVVGS